MKYYEKTVILLASVMTVLASCASGQIVAGPLRASGDLQWTGTQPGELVCVQWASSLTDTWHTSWSELGSITVTSEVAQAKVPMFYRIRRYTDQVLADYLGDRAITNIVPGVHAFVPPAGDGRSQRNGLWVVSDSSFENWGTSWEFFYQLNDWGLQLIHPLKNGQIIVHLQRTELGLSTPRRWVEVGYGSGNTNLLTRTPAFTNVFPLLSGITYSVKTTVAPSGEVAVNVNNLLVATGTVFNCYPIDFEVRTNETFPGASGWNTKQFTGTNFPLVWGKGYGGIIVKPVDQGYNRVNKARHAPGL